MNTILSKMKLLHIIQRHARPSNYMRKCVGLRRVNTLAQTSDTKGEDVTFTDSKPTKQPFVKNLFLGKFDTDVLTFPEVLEIGQLKDLENKIVPVENVVIKDASSCNSQEMLKELKALGLFGLQVPNEYGGLNLNATEYARVCEILSQNAPTAISFNAHQTYGLKGLLVAGNEQQKQEYLPRLASGEWTAAFCIAEPSGGANTFGVDTKATLSEDGEQWYINGSKILINSDGNADLITVIAQTEKQELDGKHSTLVAFLVERTFDGVSFNKTCDIVGNRGVSICEVQFKNTPVPLKNMLGGIGDGFKISSDILGNNRFSAGSFSAGILRNLMERVSEHCIKQKQLGKNLMDFELIQKKIGEIVFSIYILESLTYLTAGMLDDYENYDASVESAIVKVMSSEMLQKSILETQNILGGVEYFKNCAYDTMLRDSQVYMLLEGSNYVLRMFIALSGLQHAGLTMKDDVEKIRNPTMYPGYIFKKIFERRNHMKDNPKLTLGLDGYVHPSLGKAAQELEYGVLRLQFVVEILLARYGRSITEKEIELNRLTDIVMGLYTMTAVLARASRSYCTGIQDADYEVNIALTICHKTLEKLKQNVKRIDEGPILCFDHNYKKVAEKVFSQKGYFLDHPLSRNIF